MSLVKLDRRFEDQLDAILPPDLDDEELRARLEGIRERYHQGRLGRAAFALVTAAFVAIVLAGFPVFQVIGVVGAGVMYLVTRSIGEEKLEFLEQRVEAMIEDRRSTDLIDGAPG